MGIAQFEEKMFMSFRGKKYPPPSQFYVAFTVSSDRSLAVCMQKFVQALYFQSSTT